MWCICTSMWTQTVTCCIVHTSILGVNSEGENDNKTRSTTCASSVFLCTNWGGGWPVTGGGRRATSNRGTGVPTRMCTSRLRVGVGVGIKITTGAVATTTTTTTNENASHYKNYLLHTQMLKVSRYHLYLRVLLRSTSTVVLVIHTYIHTYRTVLTTYLYLHLATY